MKRFTFPLQALLEMRQRKEEKIELQLAEKNRSVFEAQQELTKIHDTLKELQSSEKEKREHANSVQLLRYSVAYRFKLKQDLLLAGRRIEDLKAEAVKIQKLLVIATQDRRAIELVKERRFQEWKKEYLTREQNYVDDISQQGFIRSKKNETGSTH